MHEIARMVEDALLQKNQPTWQSFLTRANQRLRNKDEATANRFMVILCLVHLIGYIENVFATTMAPEAVPSWLHRPTGSQWGPRDGSRVASWTNSVIVQRHPTSFPEVSLDFDLPLLF
jgi:hypothetical protein